MSSPFLISRPGLLFLSISPALLAAVLLALSYHPRFHQRLIPWRMHLTICAYLVSRLGLFLVIYVALGNREIGGDIRWFQWEGLGALSGKLPYRDFRCQHSPLFPYLMAVPYGIWNHIASGILVFIAFDIVCLMLLCKIARLALGPDRVSDVAWIYVVNPATWMITVRYGQDESVVATFILLAVYLYMQGIRLLNPVVLALGLLCTKVTIAIGLLIVWTYSKSKLRDATVVVFILAVVCAPFYLQGADLLTPLREESNSIVGVSVTRIIDRFLIPKNHHGLLAGIASLLTVVLTAAVVYQGHRRGLTIIDNLAAALLTFFLFLPVSYTFYRYWLLGPLAVYAVKTQKINRYILYTALLCLADDFAIERTTPYFILYPVLIAALGLLWLQIKYVYEILYVKPVQRCC